MQPTISIVEDDLAYADSLSALIASMGYPTRVYSSGADLLREFDRDVHGCLIVDLRLPDVDGMSVIDVLSNAPLPPSVIVLTGQADVPTAVRAMRTGVVAFLQKQTFSETALWEAIHQAVQQDAEQRTAHDRRSAMESQLRRLSEDELAVMKLLVDGCDHTSIAERLQISRRTVENRRSKLMKKLAVGTFPQLVSLAMEAELI